MILTTSLVGAYDLDFTFFSHYYSSHQIDKVPSLYVDLQMPPFDPKRRTQPSLRLRLPSYNQSLSKISRQNLTNNQQTTIIDHQLPSIYHFDIEKHHHPPSTYIDSSKKLIWINYILIGFCTLYDVQVSSSSLIWKKLNSEEATCHAFMSSFGKNKCLATGFTRLFCSIEDNISKNDYLKLSPYLKQINYLEHLTVAVTGSHHIYMSLSNNQMKPAKQVKILLLQGHLTVTDINPNLPIRVEYGSNCDDFSLIAPAGLTATRYRRFDDDSSTMHGENNTFLLPPCFRVIPSSVEILSSIKTTTQLSSSIESKSDEKSIVKSNSTEFKIIMYLNITNTTIDIQQNNTSNYEEIVRNYKSP